MLTVNLMIGTVAEMMILVLVSGVSLKVEVAMQDQLINLGDLLELVLGELIFVLMNIVKNLEADRQVMGREDLAELDLMWEVVE